MWACSGCPRHSGVWHGWHARIRCRRHAGVWRQLSPISSNRRGALRACNGCSRHSGVWPGWHARIRCRRHCGVWHGWHTCAWPLWHTSVLHWWHTRVWHRWHACVRGWWHSTMASHIRAVPNWGPGMISRSVAVLLLRHSRVRRWLCMWRSALLGARSWSRRWWLINDANVKCLKRERWGAAKVRHSLRR